MFTLLGPVALGVTPTTPPPSFRRVWLLDRLSMAFVSQPRSHAGNCHSAHTGGCSHAAADAQTGRLQVGEQRHRCQAGAGRRTTPAHHWWARGQWSSREKEEDREKPARRERAGPGCQSGIQIQHLLLLLLPRALEAKPPDARPRDLVLGLDQQPKSVNTHPSISGSWELFMLWSDLKSMSPDWYGWAIQAGC